MPVTLYMYVFRICTFSVALEISGLVRSRSGISAACRTPAGKAARRRLPAGLGRSTTAFHCIFVCLIRTGACKSQPCSPIS